MDLTKDYSSLANLRTSPLHPDTEMQRNVFGRVWSPASSGLRGVQGQKLLHREVLVVWEAWLGRS